MKFIVLALCFSLSSFAELDSKIFIKGKIGAEFCEKKVKVTDSLGQTYNLPRSVFPKEVVIKQGQTFNIEVDEKVMDNVKLIKKS